MELEPPFANILVLLYAYILLYGEYALKRGIDPRRLQLTMDKFPPEAEVPLACSLWGWMGFIGVVASYAFDLPMEAGCFITVALYWGYIKLLLRHGMKKPLEY